MILELLAISVLVYVLLLLWLTRPPKGKMGVANRG